MPGPQPSPGGGPPPGAMPSMGGEGIPEDMMQQLGAQAGQSGSKPTSAQAKQLQAAQKMAGKQQGKPIGTVGEELKSIPQQAWEAVKSFFSLNTWLGIDPETLSPEDKQKAVTVHRGYERLESEQKKVAQEMYQEEMEKKKKLEMEREEKQRQEQQQAANQQAVLPSTPKKGPVGPGGSKKQKAQHQLQQDRKSLSGPSGKN